jgi:hypothetical protein
MACAFFELATMSTCSTYMLNCVSCGKASHPYRNRKCCAEHCTAVCGVDCLARAPRNSFGRTNKWGVRCCAGEVRQVLNTDLAEFSIPDSAIAVGRTDDRPRPSDGYVAAAYAADATADAAPLDAAQLTALGEQAPDGGGTEAVLGVTQRNVLRVRDLSAVRVEWKGLEAALYAAGRQLMPGVGLRAELDSVLVFRREGFFRPHRALTTGTQHVGTLEVLLGPVTKEGGELVLYSRGRGIASWRPTAAGDWAMWFNTELHEVLTVTEGTRMVACYDIFVDADAVGFSAVVPSPFARRIRRRRRGVTRYAPRCTLSGVPVEVLQRIAQFLGADSVQELSVSCRRLHMAVGDPVTLLTAYFQERRAKIIGCCRAAGMTHVLLPLFHDYPLDGGKETLLRLRGRDRVMYAAAQAVFGEGVTMEPCEHIGTVDSVRYDDDDIDSVEDPEVAEEFVGGFLQSGTCPVGEARDVGKYVPQLDQFVGTDVHEFVSAVPLFTPREDMLRNCTIHLADLRAWSPNSLHKGKVPYVDVYTYRSCLLAVPV